MIVRKMLVFSVALTLSTAPVVYGQAVSARSSAEVERRAAGDSPEDPGPLAKNLSHAMTTAAVNAAMRKVADWQIRTGRERFNQQWTFAPLYDGLIALSGATGDARYRDEVEAAAESFHWSLVDVRFPHADDEALGLAYLALYEHHPAPEKIAAVRATMDRLIARPDDPSKDLWWWCDALFMAPPVLARLSKITGDPKYVQFMDREWQITEQHLYDPDEHLFFRDAGYLNKKEKNGAKLFWSRGNGWVLAGLVKVLETLPANDPLRPAYVTLFQSMATRVLSLQQPDGLWRSGLLDQADYAMPEVSGSAFFTYAFAWGINHELLDRRKFEPAVQKAWSGMLEHIYADGRLGAIQPIGAAPDEVKASSSYVYGVGAFLLAGSEIDQLLSSPRAKQKSRK